MGATNDSLVLTNVQPAWAGDYSLQVDSALGSVFSSDATLTVSLLPYAPILSDFSISSEGQPQLSVSGETGFTYSILASTNLIDWEPVFTNTAPFMFSDSATSSFPQRFYRAVYRP